MSRVDTVLFWRGRYSRRRYTYSMAYWYVRRSNGEQFGPAETSQVVQAVSERKIELDALVAEPGGVQWTALNAVPELVRALAAIAPRPPQPIAGSHTVSEVAAVNADEEAQDDTLDTTSKKSGSSAFTTGELIAVFVVVGLLLGGGGWLTHAIFETSWLISIAVAPLTLVGLYVLFKIADVLDLFD